MRTGCSDKLSKSFKNFCELNGENCKTCIKPNCNIRIAFEKCYHCNSSLNHLCLSRPELGYATVCTKYDDVCMTHISNFGIKRGCLNEQTISIKADCREKNKCAICTTEKQGRGCNTHKVLMENCVQCDTETGDDCLDHPELYKGKVCSEFTQYGDPNAREGCYLLQVSIK